MEPFYRQEVPLRGGGHARITLTLPPSSGAMLAVVGHGRRSITLATAAALGLCLQVEGAKLRGTWSASNRDPGLLGESLTDELVGLGWTLPTITALGGLCLGKISEHLESLGLEEAAAEVPFSGPDPVK